MQPIRWCDQNFLPDRSNMQQPTYFTTLWADDMKDFSDLAKHMQGYVQEQEALRAWAEECKSSGKKHAACTRIGQGEPS
jgi:hypothetical protein